MSMHHRATCRLVRDAVHGSIRLTDEEMRIIDHPLFQRLRWIGQTGLLRFIAPSAVHTRFEHSVGVLAMAQSMFDALERESRASAAKLYSVSSAEDGAAVRFYEFPDSDIAAVRRVLRICALVHDLGHGPLSHAFEAFSPSADLVRGFLGERRLAPLAPYADALLATTTGRIRHEAVSCILFATLWADLRGEPWIASAVASVLLGVDPIGVPTDLIAFIPLIRDIVSSAPIDADRMDYLLRDSRVVNVSYGLYEPDRILKSILCVASAPEGGHLFRLGWRESGLRAIENFVTARFQMYAQIYHHKTLRAIEHMLADITEHLRSSGLSIVDARSLDAFTRSYVRMSDEMFLRTLAGDVEAGPSEPIPARCRALARRILDRKLWKRLYDFKRDEDRIANLLMEALQEAHPGRRFILDRQPLRAMKDLERGARLLDLDENGKYSVRTDGRSWLDASPIMRTLRDEERSHIRLFVETEDDAPVERRAMRETAVALARSLRASIHA